MRVLGLYAVKRVPWPDVVKYQYAVARRACRHQPPERHCQLLTAGAALQAYLGWTDVAANHHPTTGASGLSSDATAAKWYWRRRQWVIEQRMRLLDRSAPVVSIRNG